MMLEILPRTAAGACIGFFVGIAIGASGAGIFVPIIWGAILGAASYIPDNGFSD